LKKTADEVIEILVNAGIVAISASISACAKSSSTPATLVKTSEDSASRRLV
jgi:hypothetical protein